MTLSDSDVKAALSAVPYCKWEPATPEILKSLSFEGSPHPEKIVHCTRCGTVMVIYEYTDQPPLNFPCITPVILPAKKPT